MAIEWAEACVYAHGQPARSSPPYSPIGQNLYVTSGSLDLEAAVQKWYDEKEFYDVGSHTCQEDQVCGHYTQV